MNSTLSDCEKLYGCPYLDIIICIIVGIAVLIFLIWGIFLYFSKSIPRNTLLPNNTEIDNFISSENLQLTINSNFT